MSISTFKIAVILTTDCNNHNIYIIYFRLKPSDIQEKCQSTLQKFNLCMFYEADMEEDRKEENLYFLDDDIIFKLVVICMATIHLLQLQGTNNIQTGTVKLW